MADAVGGLGGRLLGGALAVAAVGGPLGALHEWGRGRKGLALARGGLIAVVALGVLGALVTLLRAESLLEAWRKWVLGFGWAGALLGYNAGTVFGTE